MNIFEKIGGAWNELFTTPLGEMTALHLILLVVVCGALFIVIKWLLKYLWKGIKGFFRGLKNIISAKEHCKKHVCSSCGRTLDKCQCAKYKDKSSISKLIAYNKERKLKKKSSR